MIKEYNPWKKQKVLIMFDGMIADMINNKKRFCFRFKINLPSTKRCETKWRLQTNESFNKLPLIIYMILNTNNLRGYTEILMLSYIYI